MIACSKCILKTNSKYFMFLEKFEAIPIVRVELCDSCQPFISCFVETRNYSILSLAFIASSFRVTEENLVFELYSLAHTLLLNVFSALKGTTFYILFGLVYILFQYGLI